MVVAVVVAVGVAGAKRHGSGFERTTGVTLRVLAAATSRRDDDAPPP
jgi:hypothetical protein